MKKFSILSLISILFFSISCKKHKDTKPNTVTIEQVQNATYIYWGGTWCSPCGTYAKPVKQALHEDPKNSKTVFISFQLKNGVDPFGSLWVDTLANFYYRSPINHGAPTGWIQGSGIYERIDFPSDVKVTQVTQQAILDKIYTQTAKVNGISTISVSGNTLSVNTHTKFFENSNDSFHIQVIITENNLNATQAADSSSKKNIHDFVWRTQSGIAAYGDLLKVAPLSGQIVDKKVTVNLDPKWVRANCEVNVLIWRQHRQVDKFGAPLWGVLENAYKMKL